MSGYTLENAGIHYGSHLRMDSERNYNLELAKREMANAIGIKCDPITLYPLLSEEEIDEEIDKATKPPCLLTGDVRARLYPGYKDNPFSTVDESEAEADGGRSDKKNEEEYGMSEKPKITHPPEDEVLARMILLKNPQCLFEYNRILEVLRLQRVAREAFEKVEEVARNALADVWCLQWEELHELSVESIQRAAMMKRDRLAREYRFQRLLQRRKELEDMLLEREHEVVFHTDEMLKELDGARESGRALWKEQLASFYYNNDLYLEYDIPKQIEAQE